MRTAAIQKTSNLLGLLVALLLLAPTASLADDVKPVATLTIDQTKVSFLVSGQLGGGTLNYNGKQYRFSIGGLGVGGIGISEIEATGDVFHLKDVKDFPGAYGQARSGLVVSGVGEMKGGIWLRNTDGVVIYLKPEREGVSLNMGADAIVITMK